jgi:translation initiation factor 5B
MLNVRLTSCLFDQCTVLEVNDDKDLGTTIDVVLINGVLHKGDQVNVCTKQV